MRITEKLLSRLTNAAQRTQNCFRAAIQSAKRPGNEQGRKNVGRPWRSQAEVLLPVSSVKDRRLSLQSQKLEQQEKEPRLYKVQGNS